MKKFWTVFLTLSIISCANLFAEDANPLANLPSGDQSAMEAPLPEEPKGKVDQVLDPYWDKSSQKFDRATPNLLLGWTEVGSRAVDRYREDGSRTKKSFKFWQGAGEGLVFGLWNTTAGAIDAVTFFVPVFQTPLHDGGVNLKRAVRTS